MVIKDMAKDLEHKGLSKHNAQIAVGKEVYRVLNSGLTDEEAAIKLGLPVSVVRKIRARMEESAEK